jgi:hypothetical protein
MNTLNNIGDSMNEKTITMEKVYNKLEKLEEHVMALEHMLLPEIRLDAKTMKKAAAARKSIQQGNYTTLVKLREKYK